MVEVFSALTPLERGESDPAAIDRKIEMLDASPVLDGVLVGYASGDPHNFATATYILSRTSNVRLIVAHRPGVIHPTSAARLFGTMDFLSQGRLMLNVVAGGSDKEMGREGDFTAKTERYRRAIEYVDVMNRAWASTGPFDYAGDYYRAEAVRHTVRPANGHVPILMGGESDAALDFGARMADYYMIWAETLAETAKKVDRITEEAKLHGRSPRISLSIRLYVGDTDEEGWRRAREAERQVMEEVSPESAARVAASKGSEGRSRLMTLTERGEVQDDCFWTGITKLLGGFGNTTALVGSYDRVMQSVLRNRDLGIDSFLFTAGARTTRWDPSVEEFATMFKKATSA